MLNAYRVDAERNGLARGLLAGDTLNVDLVLETVDAGDLALAALVAAANDLDFIILSENQLAIEPRSNSQSRGVVCRKLKQRARSQSGDWCSLKFWK